jgi:hypothetical protein
MVVQHPPMALPGDPGRLPTLIRRYANLFAGLPFNELLKRYTLIEKDLLDDALADVNSFLIESGFELGAKDQTSYQKENEIISVSLDFVHSARTLVITLQSLDKSIPAMVNCFGLVRHIEIHFHESLKLDPYVLLERLRGRFVAAYEVLEASFIRSSADFTEAAYRSLYATLETALALQGKAAYFPKCRFAIADGETGFYYLDPTTIRTVVGLFKADQSDFFSPVELSIWLITSPFPFQKSVSLESIKQGFQPITLPFSSNKYIHEAPQVVRATIELFGNEDYTVRALCNVRSFFLVLALPADHADAVLPVISELEDVLKQQFENGITNCSPIIKTLKAASREISGTVVADFVASVIAKFGAELVKGPMSGA